MKVCQCGNAIPSSIIISNKRRNLKNRTKCLTCVPFGYSQYRRKTTEERRTTNAVKAKRHYYRTKEKNGGIDPIKLHREQRKKLVIAALGGKCQLCGYNKLDRNLAFHHLGDKKFRLDSRAFQYSWNNIFPEILKCVLVCHNCHGEIHAGIVDQQTVITMNDQVRNLLADRSSMVRAADLMVLRQENDETP